MNQLYEKALKLNIQLTDHQLEQFQLYYEMLVETNKVMNLTSITEYDEVLSKHFLDSLALIKGSSIDVIEDICIKQKEVSLLDIGTGAGFPAIPLKIVYPNLKITMLDSLNKRIRFLEEVIDKLELKNIQALHGRAEDFANYAKAEQSSKNKEKIVNVDLNANKNADSDMPSCGREKYDIVVSRAVANLSTLSEYCLPYVKVEGIFVAYKSEELVREQKEAERAIGILGGKIEKVFDFILPDTDFHRSLCVIRKVKVTPKKYPRKAGTPAKEPLK